MKERVWMLFSACRQAMIYVSLLGMIYITVSGIYELNEGRALWSMATCSGIAIILSVMMKAVEFKQLLGRRQKNEKIGQFLLNQLRIDEQTHSGSLSGK